MNKNTYNLIGYIPVFGKIIQHKVNFFSFKCSPFMDEFTKTEEYKILLDWMHKNPTKVISPKMAKSIISNSRKGG